MDLPVLLLAEFRKLERTEHIAVLMVNEGFDAQTMRVLAAWEHTEQKWKRPKKPCPDEGRATPASWRWLLGGWSMDVDAIAAGADVSRLTAQAKLDLLLGSRLIYPDGKIANAAAVAMRAHVAEKLRAASGGKGKKKRDDDEDKPAKSKPAPDGKVN